MGPRSFIWESFVDPETLLATYSIELARTDVLGASRYGDDTIKSNFTFGSANADWYTGKSNIYMTAQSNYSYALSSFAFGVVYQEDGVDSSEFFYELGNTYPVSFSTNFKGIGLPANLYSQFVTLLEYVTNGDVECDATVDGIC